MESQDWFDNITSKDFDFILMNYLINRRYQKLTIQFVAQKSILNTHIFSYNAKLRRIHYLKYLGLFYKSHFLEAIVY